MSDRLKSRFGKTNVVVGVIVAGLVVAIIAISLVFLKGGRYSGLEPFPVEQYQASPRNLLGNNYRLDAQVDSMINYQPGVGRLLVVQGENSAVRLPVFLPEGLSGSIHAG